MPRNALWGLAAIAVLAGGMANPAFIAKVVLSNMGDSATSAGLCMLCALLFEYLTEPPDARREAGLLVQIALVGCAVVFIRQANPALLGLFFMSAAAGLALFHGRTAISSTAKLGIALLPAAFIWYSWTRYADQQIPGGRHHLLPWAAWHWQYFGSTLPAVWRVLLRKAGYTAMTAGMAVVVGFRLRQRFCRPSNDVPRQHEPASSVITAAAAGLAFGNIAFLLFCYLATSFVPDEAKSAIAFWRFLSQTGLALTIGFFCVVPLQWLTPWLRRSWVPAVLSGTVLLLPVAAIGTYRDDLRSPAPRLRLIADQLEDAIPAGDAVTLIDFSGNGYAAVVVKYQLRVVSGDPHPISVVADDHAIPPAQARAMALPAGYIWLAEGSAAFGTISARAHTTDAHTCFVMSPGTYTC